MASQQMNQEDAYRWGERVADAWPDRLLMGELARKFLDRIPAVIDTDSRQLADELRAAYGNGYAAVRSRWTDVAKSA